MLKKKITTKKSPEADFLMNLEEFADPAEETTDAPEDETEEGEDELEEDEDAPDDAQDWRQSGNELAETEEETLEQEVSDPAEDDDRWIETEGKLPIDVFQDSKNIFIKAPMPGIDTEDIDISINNDMVTIRAKRDWTDEIAEDDYFYKECHWGSISRTIILPAEIMANKVQATLKNGVLTVTLPKAKKIRSSSVHIEQQD